MTAIEVTSLVRAGKEPNRRWGHYSTRRLMTAPTLRTGHGTDWISRGKGGAASMPDVALGH